MNKHCTHPSHIGTQPLPISSFNKNTRSQDGHSNYCKLCYNTWQYTKRAARTGTSREYRSYAPRGGSPQTKQEAGKLYFQRLALRLTPELRMKRNLMGIKSRCKPSGIPFNLSLSDILPLPTHCPDLGCELNYNLAAAAPTSASVDRILPHLGYIIGNVRIISRRANTMKQDASPEELLRVAKAWISQFSN